jgi:mRNA-degrading endonuclease RelE of RelBE toxin-antitoxin system
MNSGLRYYKISFLEQAKADLAGIPRPTLVKIQKIMLSRLSTDPHMHTKPLQYNTYGFRYLKVAEYKIIIYIIGHDVQVIGVVTNIFTRGC